MNSPSSWAVILGVSSGTGRAVARAVAERPGLDVFGMHRNNYPESAAALVEEVRALGRRAHLRVGDAGSAAAAAEGVAELLEVAGPRSVKLFVHSLANASLGHFLDQHGDGFVPKQFEKTFDSMAHSFAYWIQELVRRDALAPGARLLGLTNPLTESIRHNTGLVSAAKGALEIYVRHLAVELGPRGHRVNLLKFGTVITPAVEKVGGPAVMKTIDAIHERIIPAGRMCTADQVGRLVSLLTLEETEYFNGATIDFTGGMMLKLFDVQFPF